MKTKHARLPEGLTVHECNLESKKAIVEGLDQYNQSKVCSTIVAWTPLDFVLIDEAAVEIGGILAGVGYLGGLEIRALWVREGYRKTGIGSWLLSHVEQRAIEHGATVSMLDTFDFQAEGFYLKNGYRVSGFVDDFPKGHRRIYLSKRLC